MLLPLLLLLLHGSMHYCYMVECIVTTCDNRMALRQVQEQQALLLAQLAAAASTEWSVAEVKSLSL